MHGVRFTLLTFGLLSLVGGVSQMAAGPETVPWARLEHHVRQTLATGGALPKMRVNLSQSYAMLGRFVLSGER